MSKNLNSDIFFFNLSRTTRGIKFFLQIVNRIVCVAHNYFCVKNEVQKKKNKFARSLIFFISKIMEHSPEAKENNIIDYITPTNSPSRITKLFKKLRIESSDQNDMSHLPSEVINLIYSSMDRSSAFRASEVCRYWYECGLNFFKTWIVLQKINLGSFYTSKIILFNNNNIKFCQLQPQKLLC